MATAARARVASTRKCKNCDRKRPHSAFVGERGTVCEKCRKLGVRRASRALRLKQTYGITVEEYDRIIEVQGGTCAGCKGTRPYHLHVDHDHKIEKAKLAEGWAPADAARASVRGGLCRSCNGILRDARDNSERLRFLADYLDNPPAWEVLR